MGKTYKKKIEKGSHEKRTRIEPYTKDGVAGKFALEQNDSHSFDNKEGCRNANRSLKKGLRQKYKKELRQFLEDIPS